jgi:hypothetical protein
VSLFVNMATVAVMRVTRDRGRWEGASHHLAVPRDGDCGRRNQGTTGAAVTKQAERLRGFTTQLLQSFHLNKFFLFLFFFFC